MSLPGKLCVGILEEDNPLRSYFRFKPLLVEENGRYIPFEEADQYPDDGCIRIVPDKNESYYFKSRMRQNGLFSVVDLRDHPNENDKIRPNKNYRHGGEEGNAYIIYSDVVRAPVADMIYQLLPAETAGAPVSRPHTPKVLLKQADGINPVCHEWDAPAEGGDRVTLRATEATCHVSDFQAFDVPGFRGETLSFLIKPAALMTAVCEPIDRAVPKHEAAERPMERERPVRDERPVREERLPHDEKPASKPEVEPKREPTEPQVSAPAEKPADVPAQPAPVPPKSEPQQDPEKPWIHHDERMMPQPVDRRLSRSEQLLAAQAGLNPRRGHSLQELIDEKWQHSRLNQLGMPVSPIATGTPVQNPVDVAVEAVKNVWDNPQMRAQMLDALSRVDCFTDVIRERRELTRQSAIAEQLNALEAQRLELLGEIDRLKAGGKQVREQLKQEIRRDEAEALADATEKTRAAQAEQEKYEKLAGDARRAAEDARGALDSLVGEQLEAKIKDVALTERVRERLELLSGDIPTLPPAAEKAGAQALIDRILDQARARGIQLSREEAANLCVCLVLSPVLLISGAPGSGKTSAARVLADALGTSGAGRSVVCPPDPRPLRKDERIAALERFEGVPATVILDDANLIPGDALRGMTQAVRPEWRIIATLQDAHSGMPLCANALDQGFMVRLTPPASLPWQPAARTAADAQPLISIESVRVNLPRAEVPAALVARMETLRKEMADRGAELSRRALDDAWRYCSTMLAILGRDADADAVFDRAVAQRILPATLAAAPIEAVVRLRALTEELPLCRALLDKPLPVRL